MMSALNSYSFHTMMRIHGTRFLSAAANQVKNVGSEYFNQSRTSWWDISGPFYTLHDMNSMRVPLIRNGLLNLELSADGPINSPKPLSGMQILEVGCGGGILSEALARLGAKVTGIDIVQVGIDAAKEHASKDPEIRENLTYLCMDLDDLLLDHSASFDAVVASEVVEHVPDVDKFVASCAALTKDRGSVFMTTLNRTWKSYALGIIAAEYILRIVPRGVHEWERFVKPEDLQTSLSKCGCHTKLVKGMAYCPPTRKFSWTNDLSVNYALHAVKHA